ncbi:MAG: uracil-DNA glycosylase family protein [Candidatus Obscuribacterales bacterium]|nr:uracil-DNA glycosylase family protein [Candidatus Obscuribacterales bacterium]
MNLKTHLQELKSCRLCPNMCPPVVTHTSYAPSKVYLCGQAPGAHEGIKGKPFAWTAGKTLFRWFGSIGMDEETFRSKVYMGAVCRCFPGKGKQGGDRVPDREEIANCSAWMKTEFEILQPELLIPVGRLAIEQFLPKQPLVSIIGQTFRLPTYGTTCDIIPLPHPSGASTWFKSEPGKSLLNQALLLIKGHPSWQALI